MILRDEQGSDIDITLELLSEERVKHFCLNGRATNIFPAESEKLACEDGLFAKVTWAEESRKNEPAILKRVHGIAERNEDVKGHVPDMLCYQAFLDNSTMKILVFQRLKPITSLIGGNVLQTWWATVKRHLSPWKNGVYHRDVTLSNPAYRIVDGKIMGVLTDFDMAPIEEGPLARSRSWQQISLKTESSRGKSNMYTNMTQSRSFGS
ncbi:hypothetical protein EDC04DRAFT_77261 [Pisolithus marmoratus]|nr:hypothetical protein EDC04DRAFT_77261 [Pisolithus marmoratus]